jgi:hypothetical protein
VSLLIGTVLIIIGAILFYALALRPWLKNQAWAQRFFAWIEPIELALYKKSETVLLGRLVWLGGAIVTLYDGFLAYFGSINWQPLTTYIFNTMHLPPEMQGLALSVLVTGLGVAIVSLRKKTTKPLELVAVPDNKVSPTAQAAIARADAAKDQAVAAVRAS